MSAHARRMYARAASDLKHRWWEFCVMWRGIGADLFWIRQEQEFARLRAAGIDINAALLEAVKAMPRP